MPTIQPSEFSSVVSDYIEEFGNDAIEANETALRKVAKEVTSEMKKGGSYGGSGKFRKSIGNDIQKKRLSVEVTVGAKKNPGLTHLLEFGHAKQNGGRTTAFNFVAPINDTVEQKYTKAMEEALK